MNKHSKVRQSIVRAHYYYYAQKLGYVQVMQILGKALEYTTSPNERVEVLIKKIEILKHVLKQNLRDLKLNVQET